jgi:hypothetical protein
MSVTIHIYAETQPDDFTQVGAPPEGGYKALIAKAEVAPKKDGTGHNLVITYAVTEGEHAGKGGKDWFPLTNGSGDKGDQYRASRLAALLMATGNPQPPAGTHQFDETGLINRACVIYVKDEAPQDGKRRYRIYACPPDKAQAALDGTLFKVAGQANPQVAQAAAAFNPNMAPPPQPAPIAAPQAPVAAPPVAAPQAPANPLLGGMP